jgi:hypothetical protein
MPKRFDSTRINWLGFARPSGRTAIASPPQISLAPDSPNRFQRLSIGSVIPPEVVPSQPSIGWTAIRFPIVRKFHEQDSINGLPVG